MATEKTGAETSTDTTDDDDLDTTLGDHDESDTDDEGTGDGESEYTPPTHDEWDRTQKALAKANAEAKKWRLKARELEKAKAGDGEAASQQATDKYRPVLVKQAAKAALLEAGLVDPTPERVKKVLRLIDQDGVDIDEDGEVAGLDDQVEELKADYPEFFTKPEEQRRRVPRVNGSNRTAGAPKDKSSAARISALFDAR